MIKPRRQAEAKIGNAGGRWASIYNLVTARVTCKDNQQITELVGALSAWARKMQDGQILRVGKKHLKGIPGTWGAELLLKLSLSSDGEEYRGRQPHHICRVELLH